ncbi:MAG: hypothetical protein P4L43_18305 [Syntrophobacteraceae bacterium]|nr:hypothetical protein [Syntrophobacteraceae bacterium]
MAVAMPNVAGKGPTLIREMLVTFKEIEGGLNGLSSDASEKIKTLCTDKGKEIEPLVTKAYMKTVKAGETSWQCGQLALQIKESVAAGNEATALEAVEKLNSDLGELIHKTKNFVVRMT